MKIRNGAVMVAIAGSVLLAGCATQESANNPLNLKVTAMQKQVVQMRKVLAGQGLLDLASNQQQLQQEVADLKGQLQDFQHQIQQAQMREQNVDQSFDQRIAALEQGASAVGTGSGAHTANSAQGFTSPPLGTGGTPSGGRSDYQAYQAAFDRLKNGHNAAAVSAFKNFIKQYPNSRYVANAVYWMGSAYYVDGKYQQAIDKFQQVIQNYPQSAKASDAYLKKANSQIGLKDYQAARATLQTLIKRYPGSTAADVAHKLMSKVDAQGH